MVKKQDESSMESPKADEVSESEEDEQATKIKDSLKNSSKVYYQITHSISEAIEE